MNTTEHLRNSTRKALFIFSCFWLASCAHFQRTAKILSPTASVRTPTGVSISQTGDAVAPAQISSADSVTTLPLPKGSVLVFSQATASEPAKTSLTLSENSDLKQSQTATTFSGPKSVPPLVGPTANELATAKGIELSYWLAGALLLLCAGLAYTEHFKASIIAGLAAILTPILARFVSSELGMAVALGGLCIAGTLYAAYYLARRNPEFAAKVQTLETRVESVAAKVVS